MKHYTYILYNKAAAVAFTLLLLLLSPSCSKESGSGTPDLPDEPQLCTVTISLQGLDRMNPATRAEGDTNDEVPGTGWEEEEEQYERKMEKWVVVAYDEEGEYAGHLANTGTVNDDDNKYEISFQMELPEGTYTFFAFANWSSLEEITIGNKSITSINDDTFIEALKASNPTELKAVSAKVGDMATKFNVATKPSIPMSSYGHTEILAAPTDQVSLPLIRMIAKVRVTFDNELDEAVDITAVKVGKFQGNRPIYLVPWDLTKTEDDYYLEFDEVWQGNYEHRGPSFPHNPPEGVSANTEYNLISATEKIETNAKGHKLPSYYVNESVVHSDTHTSNMVITVTRASTTGGTNATTVSRTDFAFVRRNDLLEIPVLLSKFQTDIEFGELRLPIGVYPTKLTFGKESGVQILTPITYHVKSTGELKIKYTLMNIVKDSEWAIRYPSGDGDYLECSSAQLVSNQKDLLMDEENNPLLTNSKIELTKETSGNGTESGSFTIRTQELGSNATAQILLTLIVEYGGDENKRDIEIPYTINITNAPESTTDEGGESTKGGKA